MTHDIYFEGRIYQGVEHNTIFDTTSAPHQQINILKSYSFVVLTGPHSFTNGQEVVEGKDYEVQEKEGHPDSLWAVSKVAAAIDKQIMTLEEIMKIRNQLPDTWIWNKCYELSYVDIHRGGSVIKKHWALTTPDRKSGVHSLGLISHDSTSTKTQFFNNDIPVQFVEKSLLIIDTLIAEINRLKFAPAVASVELPEGKEDATEAKIEAIAYNNWFLKRMHGNNGGFPDNENGTVKNSWEMYDYFFNSDERPKYIKHATINTHPNK